MSWDAHCYSIVHSPWTQVCANGHIPLWTGCYQQDVNCVIMDMMDWDPIVSILVRTLVCCDWSVDSRGLYMSKYVAFSVHILCWICAIGQIGALVSNSGASVRVEVWLRTKITCWCTCIEQRCYLLGLRFGSKPKSLVVALVSKSGAIC